MRTQDVHQENDQCVSMDRHFAQVSERYGALRITDIQPVLDIRRHLPSGPLTGVDVGAGTGRYTALMADLLDDGVSVLALDRSAEMLAMMSRDDAAEVPAVCCEAELLPVADHSVDFVTTFNAIHHFDLERFVAEASRVLRPDGQLFIYTRTPEQNAQSIWGRFFPEFNERECRLFDRSALHRAARRLGSVDMTSYRYPRRASRSELVARVRGGAYSTFALYSAAELDPALERFLDSVGPHDEICWDDRNTLIHVRRGS